MNYFHDVQRFRRRWYTDQWSTQRVLSFSSRAPAKAHVCSMITTVSGSGCMFFRSVLNWWRSVSRPQRGILVDDKRKPQPTLRSAIGTILQATARPWQWLTGNSLHIKKPSFNINNCYRNFTQGQRASCRFALLSTFRLSNRTPKISPIFDAVSRKRGNFWGTVYNSPKNMNEQCYSGVHQLMALCLVVG